MKTLLLSILMLLFSVEMVAEIVPISEAIPAAKRAYQIHCQNITINPVISESIILKDINENPILYIFNFSQGGFVIISAESNAKPVLAFSANGNFSNYQEKSNVQQWIENYKNEISAIRQHNLAQHPQLQQAWNFYKSQNSSTQLGGGSVSPMLTTLWSQGCYYNDSTPTDSSGSCYHPVTGCVATAMAQVMKYYNFPPNGSGTHSYQSNYGLLTANFATASYNWALMPNSLNSSSSSAEVAQVAQLMSHCGISVDMQYTAGSSGAYSIDAKDAFVHYFNYSKDIKYLDRANYADSIWEEMLRTELDSSRVVYYSGSGTGGHAFVCDGYQNGNYFHFNWGWSGSMNGYFLVGNLNPGGMYFSNYSSAIFGIKPEIVSPCVSLKTFSSTEGGFSDGSASNNYTSANDCSWLIQPTSGVDISLKFFTFSLAAGDTVKVYDGNSTASALLGSYTGNNVPATINSTGSSMLVKFTSDAQNEGAGFSASYQANYCKGLTTLTQATDTFDDGSSSELYRDNTYCTWLIQPQNAASIRLNFLNFNTESGFDFVKIYNGSNSGAPLLGSFSGNNLPNILNSTGGSMYIEFICDGGVVDQGWKASYTACFKTPSISFSDTFFCKNDSVQLATSLAAGNFTWLYNNQPMSVTTQSFYAKIPGAYSLVSSLNGCPADTTIQTYLTEYALPVINLGSDTVFGCTIPNPYFYNAPTGNYSYLWQNGSTNSSYEVNQYNLNIGNNIIWCQITDNHQCTNSDSILVVFSLGIDEKDANTILRIHPNPSNGIFVVQSEFNTPVVVNIFNAKSELVYKKEINAKSSERMDISNLNSGIYLLQIVQNSKTISKKLIIE